ncbi:sulfite exporter TauE/SafE family protein [Ollibium composti]|uniref:Probable membrane transporter protein n=1 Tax=Ollibium composti TaxID=2675109 RepID=A0ABY2Q2S5_9HYPH|nr:sulfite exporter TauE/SafE family protein [Mesorhizobium composti]THF55294.1 sulfite exporter TauE/SafE family protein [Mesorhizobium composti]
MTDSFFFFFAVIAATLFAGLSKGGFAGVGMVSTPILALVMPPVQAASVMLPILLIQDAYSVVSYRRTVDRRNLAILLPGAVLGIALGYSLASYLPQAAVALAIGVISVGFSLLGLRGRTVARSKRPAKVAPGMFWGALSGFTSMIAHAGTPPFQIYVMPQRLERDLFVGTSVVFFAVVNWMKVLPYTLLGQFSAETLKLSFLLAPLALFSTWLGIRLVRRTDTERFYLIAYVLLGLVGLSLGWDGLKGLFFA